VCFGAAALERRPGRRSLTTAQRKDQLREDKARQVAELERKVGRQTLLIVFCRESLQACRGFAPGQQAWREGIYREIRRMMPLEGDLSVAALCAAHGYFAKIICSACAARNSC
jgi:hypothetical protein